MLQEALGRPKIDKKSVPGRIFLPSRAASRFFRFFRVFSLLGALATLWRSVSALGSSLAALGGHLAPNGSIMDP